jgi:hypothetical protein
VSRVEDATLAVEPTPAEVVRRLRADHGFLDHPDDDGEADEDPFPSSSTAWSRTQLEGSSQGGRMLDRVAALAERCGAGQGSSVQAGHVRFPPSANMVAVDTPG